MSWEVLNGVGVDGVGRIFPFFSPFFLFVFPFLFFVCFSSFFFWGGGGFFVFFFLRFSGILLEDKGKRLQFTAKMGISLRPRLHRPRAKLPECLTMP